MAEVNPPWGESEASLPAANDRNMLAALLAGTGVVGATDMTPAFGSGMNVTISAGDLFIPGTGTRHGVYHIYNDASVTKTLGVGSSQPRKDLIVAHIYDDFYDSSGSNLWALEIIAGTPASSPVEPSAPNNCYIICEIDVPASIVSLTGGGATLNDRRAPAAGLGGTAVYQTQAQIQASSGVRSRVFAVPQDTHHAFGWNNSDWVGMGAFVKPTDQFFPVSLGAGTATAYADYETDNNILTAPYPLTMVVTLHGYTFTAGGGCDVHLRIEDQTGAEIMGNANNEILIVPTASGDRHNFTIMGHQHYAQGATVGFRCAYKIANATSAPTLTIDGEARVEFIPTIS